MFEKAIQQVLLAHQKRIGLFVFIGLAVLSLAEYWLSVTIKTGIMIPLIGIALLKFGLILQYFMHVSHLRHSEEHGHE